MNSPECAELPPAQIWARELDAGRYHCSVSTVYRILRERGQCGERRRQATQPGFDAFISYYNHERRNSGIGFRTPASVHFGTTGEVRDQRAATFSEAYARHPSASVAVPDCPRYRRRPGPTTRPSAGNPRYKPYCVKTVPLDLKSSGPANHRPTRLSHDAPGRGEFG